MLRARAIEMQPQKFPGVRVRIFVTMWFPAVDIKTASLFYGHRLFSPGKLSFTTNCIDNQKRRKPGPLCIVGRLGLKNSTLLHIQIMSLGRRVDCIQKTDGIFRPGIRGLLVIVRMVISQMKGRMILHNFPLFYNSKILIFFTKIAVGIFYYAQL